MVTFLQQDMHLGEDYQVTRNQLRQLLS
jgi:hypothetical protein